MRRPTGLLLAAGAATAAVAAGVLSGGAAVGDPAPTPAPTTARAPLTAAGSALPVSRRADPSIDRYTRSPRPATAARRMTDAQRWLSRRAQPFVAHDSDATVSLNLLGWATSPQVHAYVNATGVNAYNREGLRDARRWLVSAGGRPVSVDGWRMLDIRRPQARRWWLLGSDGKASCTADRNRRAALDLIACGYTGLWIDNVLTVPAQWFAPDPRIDAGDWGEALVALLTELRAALPAGTPFTINAHWTDLDYPWAQTPALDPAAPLVRAAAIADQLVIEGGAIDPGLDYGGAPSAAWSWARLLGYVDALHGAGVRVQWEKVGSGGLLDSAARQLGVLPSCRDGDYRTRQPAWGRNSAAWRGHVRTAGFNLASALLTFAPGDGVGDMCEYPGRGFAAYGVDFGAPLGARAAAGPLTVRAFEQGYVAVNPTMAAAPLTLPDGRTGVDLASRSRTQSAAAAGTFTLPPRTAAIVHYRAGPPAAR